MTTLIKVGGELLEGPDDVRRVVEHVAAAAAEGPLVVVHGGGRELSLEVARRGGTATMVEGIRVTDAETLAAAVSVLGGTINTRLVAALLAGGVRAVGLTGVDGSVLRCERAAPVRSRSGGNVDLGLVGTPVAAADPALIRSLCRDRWVPVVASIGVTDKGELLNVNADVAAAHLAVALRVGRFLVLGTTDGVFDERGVTVPTLASAAAEALVQAGAAKDGMAAKLAACTRASAAGVADVRIVNGRARSLTDGGTRLIGGTAS